MLATDTDSGYENKARRIANEIGLRVKVVEHTKQECPKWGRRPDGRCDHVHGLRYRVTLHFSGGGHADPGRSRGSLSFDFWNSQNDAQKGAHPSYYDVLACVSSDASMPTDPDDIVEELGPMKPSQAVAAARFAKRLQAFFTEGELRHLSEIA